MVLHEHAHFLLSIFLNHVPPPKPPSSVAIYFSYISLVSSKAIKFDCIHLSADLNANDDVRESSKFSKPSIIICCIGAHEFAKNGSNINQRLNIRMIFNIFKAYASPIVLLWNIKNLVFHLK